PGFCPHATLALPQAMIAVMGPEAAVNAVFFNKIQEKPEAERAAYVAKLREEYRADVDLSKLASELVIDDIVPGDELRSQLERRYELYSAHFDAPARKKHGVLPV
ncbi:MAG TPA: carboxyl transferase domain-containing protein, partial [Myxococcales bacterium]|nr:carboxyl transferase domain-containing protein [Myxococcales bacterium]